MFHGLIQDTAAINQVGKFWAEFTPAQLFIN
jgi:hypothetical protein